MPVLWTCPRCGRVFRRAHQRHSCAAGGGEEPTRGRPEALVALYRRLEETLESWGGVEFVRTRRYVLFRTTRVFADLVFMKDALRLALLLDREVRDPIFFKVGAMSAHRIAHVARIRTPAELRAVLPYLREAHRFAHRA